MITLVYGILKKKTLFTNTQQTKRDQIFDYQRWGFQRGEVGESGQKIQTSTYKVNKCCGCNVQCDDYS